MKSLRGLRWALKSTKPRNVCFIPTLEAPVSFSTKTLHRRAARVPGNSTRHALSQPLRAVMRQLPHPVVVITTLENSQTPTKMEEISAELSPRPIPRAMTVSSFTSLSIDPVPRVTFNVTLPSTTHQALVRCGRFNAHILSGDDHGARIADLFTRGNRSLAAKEASEDVGATDLGVLASLEKFGVRVLGQDQWQQEWEQAGDYRRKSLAAGNVGSSIAEVELPRSGTLPVLQGQGIMHVLKCEYRHLTPPVDSDFDHHAIVMGEVLDIVPGEASDENDIALAYADRAYRQMGDKLLERPATNETASSSADSSRHIDVSRGYTNHQKRS